MRIWGHCTSGRVLISQKYTRARHNTENPRTTRRDHTRGPFSAPSNEAPNLSLVEIPFKFESMLECTSSNMREFISISFKGDFLETGLLLARFSEAMLLSTLRTHECHGERGNILAPFRGETDPNVVEVDAEVRDVFTFSRDFDDVERLALLLSRLR